MFRKDQYMTRDEEINNPLLPKPTEKQLEDFNETISKLKEQIKSIRTSNKMLGDDHSQVKPAMDAILGDAKTHGLMTKLKRLNNTICELKKNLYEITCIEMSSGERKTHSMNIVIKNISMNLLLLIGEANKTATYLKEHSKKPCIQNFIAPFKTVLDEIQDAHCKFDSTEERLVDYQAVKPKAI